MSVTHEFKSLYLSLCNFTGSLPFFLFHCLSLAVQLALALSFNFSVISLAQYLLASLSLSFGLSLTHICLPHSISNCFANHICRSLSLSHSRTISCFSLDQFLSLKSSLFLLNSHPLTLFSSYCFTLLSLSLYLSYSIYCWHCRRC